MTTFCSRTKVGTSASKIDRHESDSWRAVTRLTCEEFSLNYSPVSTTPINMTSRN